MSPTQLRLASAVVGAAIGLGARNVPTVIAAQVVRPPALAGCGMERVLECIARDAGTIFVGVAQLAIVATAICAIAAVLGVIAGVVGLMSRHPVTTTVLVGAGVMLIVPAVWLAASFVVFLWT